MINIIQSEFLKYKRTFTKKLIVFAPLLFSLIALPQRLFMPEDYLGPWELLISMIYNWWPVIFVPLGIALFAALVEFREKKAGSYRGLLVHNISPAGLWMGKIATMSGLAFLTTVTLIIVIIISGLIAAKGPIPWFEIFAGGFLIWLVSLALIPIQLWAATWKGTFFSMAVGFLGLILGVWTAPKSSWLYVPWSWSTRLMCPLIGVHPNGTMLDAMDSLRDFSVIPRGIVVSIITFLGASALTAYWFSRREVK
ncbi:MAG: lantibiotic immunity ABC transporter MutE/EpiE family permease subunit [Bacillota bacterium]